METLDPLGGAWMTIQLFDSRQFDGAPKALDEIHPILAALPKAWPSGSVQGLRACGGFVVDITWRDGKATDYQIRSETPREVTVCVNGETRTIRSTKS